MLPVATSVSRTRAFLCHACRYQHHNCKTYSSNGQLSARLQQGSTPERCKAFFSSADHIQIVYDDLKRDMVKTDTRHLTVSDNTTETFQQIESNSEFLPPMKSAYRPCNTHRNSSALKSDFRDSYINHTSVKHVEMVKCVTHTVKDIWGFEPNSFQKTNEKWVPVHVVGNMKLNAIAALTSEFMSKSDLRDTDVQKNDLRDIIAQHRKLSCACGTNTKSFISMKMKNLYYLRANSDTKPLLMAFFWTRSKLLNRKSHNFSLMHCMFHGSARNLCTSCDERDNSWVVRLLPPWRILFFGTDDIALHTLKDLYANMYVSCSCNQTNDKVHLEIS